MQQKDNILSLEALRVNVGNSLIIGITVESTQSALIIKSFSGGSLLIAGASSELINNAGFLVDSPLSINMCGTFYLMANGATAVAMILKGLA